jgi:hypothetical protein
MAIPAEFTFANEDAFVQDFLIPLLRRLGFAGQRVTHNLIGAR